MTKDDEPREKRQRWGAADTTSAATAFAGNIMALVALTLLFDADEDRAESADQDTGLT